MMTCVCFLTLISGLFLGILLWKLLINMDLCPVAADLSWPANFCFVASVPLINKGRPAGGSRMRVQGSRIPPHPDTDALIIDVPAEFCYTGCLASLIA